MVWDRIAAGNGKVFGLELSEAMLKEVEGNLVSKASIPGLTNRIILDRVCFMLYMVHTTYSLSWRQEEARISMEETSILRQIKGKAKITIRTVLPAPRVARISLNSTPAI